MIEAFRELRRYRAPVLLAVFGVLVSGAGWASMLEHPYIHRDARLLGMASAETALESHPNPLFSNPAALVGLAPGWTVTPLSLSLGSTRRMRGFLVKLEERLDIEDKDEQREALTDLLADYRGRNLHAQVTTTPLLAWNGQDYALALSWLGSLRLDARPHQGFGRDGVLDVNGRTLSGPLLGAAIERGAWRFGINVKDLSRKRVARGYSIRELVAITSDDERDFSDDLVEGRDQALDLGVQYQLAQHSQWQPRLGVNLQNLGDLDFGPAGRIRQRLNVGIAATPPTGPFPLEISAEYVDLLHRIPTDDDVLKRTRLGARWQIHRQRFSSLAVSAGLYQGEPSLGVDGELAMLGLSAATYVEEQGAFAGQDPERRYVLGLSVGF